MDVNPIEIHFRAIISMCQIFKYSLVSSSKSLMNETKKNKNLEYSMFNFASSTILIVDFS